MAQRPEFEETCERYLLGELSESEAEQFEEAYFADDALFEEFEAVKDDLLDAYARGELAEEKRKRFAAHFLATAPRRRQFEETQNFIRAMTAVSVGAAAPDAAASAATRKTVRQSFVDFFRMRPFVWQTGFAALVLLAFAGTWMFLRLGQQSTRDDQTALQSTPLPTNALPISENSNAAPSPVIADTNQSIVNTNAGNKSAPKNTVNSNQTPAKQNADPEPSPKSPSDREPQIPRAQIASILLLPVASRDINESNTLRVDPDTRAVRLQLTFRDGGYRNYSAAVTTIEGASVWRQKTLKTATSGANRSAILQFAPALLRGQDYIVTLSGQTAAGRTEIIGEYYFRVERSRRSPNTPTQTPTPER